MKNLSLNFLLFLISLIFLSKAAWAFNPESHLSDHDEKRARNVFMQVKCPVCSGQTIEDSDANAAYELRNFIRKQIILGKTDEEIKSDLVKTYGSDIINTASFGTSTIFLWCLPLFFLIMGICLMFLMIVANKKNP